MTIPTSAGPCDSPAVESVRVTRGDTTAPRMTSIGAGTPVQRSKRRRALADEHLEAVDDHVAAGGARRLDERGGQPSGR